MVVLLMFRSLLPLLLNASVLDALITGCTWFLLDSVCLLLNLGNRFKTELIILEKVLGLLAKETKNLCLLGSVTYNC